MINLFSSKPLKDIEFHIVAITYVIGRKNEALQTRKALERENSSKMPTTVNYGIRDVWKDNMEEEFAKIRDIVQDYPFVAMVDIITCILYVRI